MFTDGYAFSQDENGVVSQSEVIRAYDTTKQRTNTWWGVGLLVHGRPARSHGGRFQWRYLKLNGEKRWCVRVPPALRGRGVWKETEERDIVSSLEKRDLKEKHKEQNKSRSLSAVVVCRADMIRALCFLSSLWSEVLHCSFVSFLLIWAKSLKILLVNRNQTPDSDWFQTLLHSWKIAKEQSCIQSSKY